MLKRTQHAEANARASYSDTMTPVKPAAWTQTDPPLLLLLSLTTDNTCLLRTIHVTAQQGDQMGCKVVGTVTAGHAHGTQTQQNSHTTQPDSKLTPGTQTAEMLRAVHAVNEI
jgi:hypothetical protein